MTDPTNPLPDAPKRSFLRRHWGKTLLAVLLLTPPTVFAAWAAIALSYTYSSGERAGFVQKVSRKGWICKTWEGVLYTDIAKGFRSDSFSFTVRSDSLARVIEELSGRKVALRYDQHVGLPSSCFGETEYFVKGVRELDE